MKKAIIAVLLILFVIIMALAYEKDNYGENSLKGSGQEIVEVALDELGTLGGDKYRKWYTGYADGEPWCATFVSWCANEIGLIESGVLPKFQGCTFGITIFQKMGIFTYTLRYGGIEYTPKSGDIVFYTETRSISESSHVGIVKSVQDGQLIVIEGNASNSVKEVHYSLNDDFILGYAFPNYPVRQSVIEGNSYAEISWNYLKALGFNDYAAAGILGNLQQESGIDPNKKQSGGGPGRGICQWEIGGRFETLKAFAEDRGREAMDIEIQLEFLWYELNGGDPTTKLLLERNYGGIVGLMNAESIEWAVEAFEKSFERAGIPNMPNRVEYAFNHYNTFSKASQ